jgi:hypothetical protein
MTDWTTVDLNNLLPGEPWTSGKALAVYENPIAITEGATGAPKIVATALAGNRLPAFGANTGWAGLTDLGAVDEIFFAGFVRVVGRAVDPVTFQVRFSNDNGSTWATEQTLYTIPANPTPDTEAGAIAMTIDLVTGVSSIAPPGPISSISNPTLTIPSGGADAIQFRVNGTGHFRLTASITAGKA